MTTNWQTKKLSEICEIVNGGTPKTNILKYWNGDILWITPKDIGKLESFFVAEVELKKYVGHLSTFNGIYMKTDQHLDH